MLETAPHPLLAERFSFEKWESWKSNKHIEDRTAAQDRCDPDITGKFIRQKHRSI